MLNWIAIWVGSYLFGEGGPLQGSRASIPVSNTIVDAAKLPGLLGAEAAPGPVDRDLHRARDARPLLGARQPHDARLRGAGGRVQPGGRALRRHLRRHGTTSSRWRSRGAFAGLAGAIDVTGWEYQIGPADIQASQIGFIGLAAALLGRNTAVGVGFASLLFGALINGTSSRQLDPTIFRPDLAENLTIIIQGLVVLFVGLNLGGALDVAAPPKARMSRWTTRPRTVGIAGIALGGARVLARAAAARGAHGGCCRSRSGCSRSPPASGQRRAERVRTGGTAIAAGVLGIVLGVLATRSSVGASGHASSSGGRSARRPCATRRRSPSRRSAASTASAAASSTSRSKGCCSPGAFFGIWGAIWAHSWAGGLAWVVGLAAAALAGMALAAIHAVWAISFKTDQIISGTALNFLALGITGYLFVDKYGDTGTPGNVPDYGIPDIHLHFLQNWTLIGPIFGQLNLMIWLSFALLIAHVRLRLPDAVGAAAPVGRRASSRGGHRRHLGHQGPVRRGDRVRRDRGDGRRVPLARLRPLVQPGDDERHRLHRPRGAHLRQVAARSRRGARRCSSASRAPSPTGSRPPTATSGARCSRRCRTCSR